MRIKTKVNLNKINNKLTKLIYFSANKKLEAMLDVSKAQAELKLLRSERDVLKERLQCEEDARQLLEDHVKVIKTEVEKLHEKGEAAEREKQDALTRLEVLSEYFKEKEAQLQKYDFHFFESIMYLNVLS